MVTCYKSNNAHLNEMRSHPANIIHPSNLPPPDDRRPQIDIAMPRVMSLTASTSFEVRTPRQFKVRLTKVGLDTYIQTPALASHLDIPDSLTVLGQTLDLSPLRALVAAPVNAGIDTARALVGAAVAPAIGMGAAEAASLWMLTTYLDDSLRVSRDDAGKVFVLIKEVA